MQPTSTNSQDQNNRSIYGLLAWLLLVPMVLSSLVCFGQLALVLNTQFPSAITLSLLNVDYGLWSYDEIAPINLAAFMEDVRREQRLYGQQEPEEVVTGGVYWIPPTPTLGGMVTNTATSEPQPTETSTATYTPSFPPSSATPSPLPTFTALPTITPSPTRTNTFPPPRPSPTHTKESSDPPPPASTPTNTNTPVVAPTVTFTPIPTSTFTPLPTLTLTLTLTKETPDEPVLPTPTYAPVRPIAEDGGISEPFQGGCRAYFGYRNANPQEVNIPIGQPRNYFSVTDAVVEPSLPDQFLIGRVVGAFYVVWTSGEPFSWYLEGAEAVAQWCNP
jgi:hypothetical protein